MAAPKRQLPLIHPRTIPFHWIVGVGMGRKNTPAPLPGCLCETCLDAPAIAVVPAPWGGEMGVCARCQGTRGEV